MIVHAFRCDTCKQEIFFAPDSMRAEWSQVPPNWITLMTGNPRIDLLQHFCSRECLAQSVGVQPVAPTEQPQSKMRRFLLIDGETADEFEGVQFGNGMAAINVGEGRTRILPFRDWDHLKEMNAGSGVTWIDQEVSDAK